MKGNSIVLSVVGFAMLAIGSWQWHTLSELHQEGDVSRVRSPQGGWSRGAGEIRPRPTGASSRVMQPGDGREHLPDALRLILQIELETPEGLRGKRFEGMIYDAPLSSSWGTVTMNPDYDRLRKWIALMGHATGEELIGELESALLEQGMNPMEVRQKARELVAEAFLDGNPSRLLAMADALEGMKHFEEVMAAAFRYWSADEPVKAMAWLEKEKERDDPLASLPGIQRKAVQLELRSSPGKALNHILAGKSEDENLDEKERKSAMNDVVSEIVGLLQTPDDMVDFFSAIRSRGSSADAEWLENIRSMLVDRMTTHLIDHRAEDVMRVVDAGFTPEERRSFLGFVVQMTDTLDMPEQWIPWLLAEDQRNIANNHRKESLIDNMVYYGAQVHPARVERWLEQIGPENLHPKTFQSFIEQTVIDASDLAWKWFGKMPEGDLKRETERRFFNPEP